MWVPVDHYDDAEAKRILPASILEALEELEDHSPTDLTSGDFEYAILDMHVAGSLGIGLFSADVKGDRVLMSCSSVVFEELQATNGIRVRKGGGLRLLVGISRVASNFKLSLPAIAAAAEVGLAQAMFRFAWMGLDRQKLADPLAKVTTNPEPLSLDGYKGTLNAMSELQNAVLRTDGAIIPRDLSVWMDEGMYQDWTDGQAAGRTYALTAIANRKTLDSAIREISRGQLADSSIFEQATRGTYFDLRVPEGEEPPDSAANYASGVLGDFRLHA